jgi:hypothetical protein
VRISERTWRRLFLTFGVVGALACGDAGGMFHPLGGEVFVATLQGGASEGNAYFVSTYAGESRPELDPFRFDLSSAPIWDSCAGTTPNPLPAVPALDYLDVGTSIGLVLGTSSVAMARLVTNGAVTYATVGDPVLPPGLYRLDIPGSAEAPPASLVEALQVPPALSVEFPPSFEAGVHLNPGAPFKLQWATAESSYPLRLFIVDSNMKGVRCDPIDDGTFTVLPEEIALVPSAGTIWLVRIGYQREPQYRKAFLNGTGETVLRTSYSKY